MDVHAGTIVALDGLGHERSRLAVGGGDVVNRVLENLRPVGALDERIEAGADFALACAAHFMVMDFNVNTLLFKQRAHFRAHVGKGIDGRDGEVAALDAVVVAEVATFRLETGRPGTFFAVDFEEALAHAVFPADAVEDEELGFGTEIGRVTNARRLQIGFGAQAEGTRITVIVLAGLGFVHVALENEGVDLSERVHADAIGIRHQKHVGGFNAAPADKGRAVKGLSKLEHVLVNAVGGNRHVHFLAERVREAKVHELDIVVLDHLQNIRSGRHLIFLLEISR